VRSDVLVEKAIDVKIITKVDLAVVWENFPDQLVDEVGDSSIETICIPAVYERDYAVTDHSSERVQRTTHNLREVRQAFEVGERLS